MWRSWSLPLRHNVKAPEQPASSLIRLKKHLKSAPSSSSPPRSAFHGTSLPLSKVRARLTSMTAGKDKLTPTLENFLPLSKLVPLLLLYDYDVDYYR